ncbi:MAG: hypothetical protein Q4G26_02225 [Paracoccus sp. (in: a-proteobacteria)]|nr:hypothetical protein [Paracoccus sp. (in: a-proteobacteria)]
MQAAGLRIGHEHARLDGIVSWMLPGERDKNPYRHALGPLKDFHHIFCVTRAPLDALASIIPENDDLPSFTFRSEILADRFGIALPDPQDPPARLLAAVISYTLWFELCMSFLPELIYRVDRPEDDALLSDYLNREIRRNDDIDRNSRPRRRAAPVTPDDLARLSPEWLTRFGEMAEGLGYPEDAATIRAASP